jgi:hypothetical protein
MAPGLAAATVDLEALSAAVDELGRQARLGLAALVAADLERLESAIEDGDRQVVDVRDRASALRARLLALPGVAPDAAAPMAPTTELVLGEATRTRFSMLYDALDATTDLPTSWARFTSSSLAAQGLTTVLLDHDASTGQAARLGSSAKYAEAIAQLDTSDAHIATAEAARDKLANTVDVATLTEWIDRNKAYDAALRALYDALARSNGRVNDEVRDAFEAEQAARDRLPPDTRGLVVILAEMARGGMNQAAIGIEDAAIRLRDAAVAAEAPLASPTPTP